MKLLVFIIGVTLLGYGTNHLLSIEEKFYKFVKILKEIRKEVNS